MHHDSALSVGFKEKVFSCAILLADWNFLIPLPAPKSVNKQWEITENYLDKIIRIEERAVQNYDCEKKTIYDDFIEVKPEEEIQLKHQKQFLEVSDFPLICGELKSKNLIESLLTFERGN